jgi:cell shape-determining protein MreC
VSRGAGGFLAPLPIALAILLLLALTPTRLTRWAGALSGPANFVVLPISHPLLAFSRMLRSEAAGVSEDPQIEALQIQRDDLALRLARARARVDELERLVGDLQGGLAVAPESGVRAFEAPVVSMTPSLEAGLLRIGAGEREGVVAGASVAVARGVHLVGRVESVDARTCVVAMLSAPSTGWIEALVMVDDPETGWGCQLEPISGGRLRGDMVADATGIRAGQTVRLADRSWPASAQMLVIGRVEEATQRENGRWVVTVRPVVDAGRLGEVVLRAPQRVEDEGAP